MRSLLGLCAILALSACGPAQTAFPPGVEQNFMLSCGRSGGAAALCACTWDKIEAEISPSDFIALERLPGPERENHAITRQIADMAAACYANQATEAPAAEPAPAQ